jgi:WD40 repeat protein
VRLRDLESGAARRTLEGHADGASCVAFSPDGRSLATGGSGRIVRLWDLKSGAARRTLEGHADRILCVAFSPDGRSLAVGGSDGTVRLWDLEPGGERWMLEGHTGGVLCVAFSPDGRSLAIGVSDGSVRLREFASGTLLGTFCAGAEGWAAFTTTGRYKVAGSVAGLFWYAIGLCRFEPGELDPFLPPGTLVRLKEDEPLWTRSS